VDLGVAGSNPVEPPILGSKPCEASMATQGFGVQGLCPGRFKGEPATDGRTGDLVVMGV